MDDRTAWLVIGLTALVLLGGAEVWQLRRRLDLHRTALVVARMRIERMERQLGFPSPAKIEVRDGGVEVYWEGDTLPEGGPQRAEAEDIG